MSRYRLAACAAVALLAAARFCHLRILWVEEAYPMAASIQMLNRKLPYTDFWYDKPPLAPVFYLPWGAWSGWPLRLAGALYVALACWFAYRIAKQKWSEHEGLWAAVLLAFFLTFDIPSAVMPLAPDLLLVVPHLAAVYCCWRGRPFAGGLWAGVGLLVNPKAVFVFAACLLWQYRKAPLLLLGFALPQIVLLGCLPAYFEQVWRWGFLYARDTLVENPIREGLLRTLNWAGFHAALVFGAVWCLRRERDWRMMAWVAISLAAVAGGWRFFPRYYLQLLPVMTLLAARGIGGEGLRPALKFSLVILLLIPLARFGPRYLILAADLIKGREHSWSDLEIAADSRQASQLIRAMARPRDTLLVWGYRPDIFVYTRLPAGTRFLDSQPLTGVIADRHLSSSGVSAPDLAARNRSELVNTRPAFVVDGLGPFNPTLAIDRYPDLREWLSHYRIAARTAHCIVYTLSERQ